MSGLLLLFLLPSCSSDEENEGGGGQTGDTWGINQAECTVEGENVAVSFDLVRPFGVQPEGVKVVCNGQEYAVEATSEWNCRASVPRRGLVVGMTYKAEVYAVSGGTESLAGACNFQNRADETWPRFENLDFEIGAEVPSMHGSFTWQDGNVAVEEAGFLLFEDDEMPSSYTPDDLWKTGQHHDGGVTPGLPTSMDFDGLKWGTEYVLVPYMVTPSGIVLGERTNLRTRLPFRITVTEPPRYQTTMPLIYRVEIEAIDPSCKVTSLGTTAFGEPNDLVSGSISWDDKTTKESCRIFIYSIGLRKGASYNFGIMISWVDGEGNEHSAKPSEIVDGKRYYFRAR